MNKKIIEYFLLSILIFGAFLLRLYKIDNPIADWHSWRQADTAAVSRNFVQSGFDLLHPRFDDLSSLVSGKENPEGWRFVEFPLYNFLHASLSKFFPIKPLEWWGRMLSIIFSLGSIIFLYLLAKKYLGKMEAFWTAFFFAVLPYSVFYSRVVLPEPMVVFTSLGMLYFFDRWVDSEKFYLGVLAVLFAMATALIKPFYLVLFLPMAYLAFRKFGLGAVFKLRFWLFLLFALVPFVFWRFWMLQYPEGIPRTPWLFNFDGIRFKGAFFYWIFAERTGRLILGFWGLPLLFLGILARLKKEGLFLYLWLLGVISYLFIVAGGNVTHDYYQVMAIPIFCLFLAKGIVLLLFPPQKFNRLVAYFLLPIALVFMFAFSWYEVRGFYNINHPEIVEAGQRVNALTTKSAKVIAPYSNDTAFLYQTNRRGWPGLDNSIDYLISRGATHYVSVNFDETTKNLMEQYQVLEKTDRYIIIDLIHKQ